MQIAHALPLGGQCNLHVSVMIHIILKYFPHLSEEQQKQFLLLKELYEDWNAKINVISRKDIDALYERHVLHSLAIAKFIAFKAGTQILDVGTGGGFPGIPLAMVFPEVHFTLIDSIGKKIKVATAVAEAIGLKNVTLKHENVKEEKGRYDFVMSRAVMNASELLKMSRKNLKKEQRNALPNGIICLKGGDLSEETDQLHHYNEIIPLTDYFTEPFFQTKKILYIPT